MGAAAGRGAIDVGPLIGSGPNFNDFGARAALRG